MKTKHAILHYQLNDVLEMHFSKKKEAINIVKEILLRRPIKDFNLHWLFSFVLEDALVVIRDGDLDRIKRLYLLNADSEAFKTYCVHSIHRERRKHNGSEVNDSFRSERLAPA
jgi:hypothetical protein